MEMPMILAFLCAAVVLPIGVYFSAKKCPSCERRWTIRPRHSRKDGKKDLRFNDNPLICDCGWREY